MDIKKKGRHFLYPAYYYAEQRDFPDKKLHSFVYGVTGLNGKGVEDIWDFIGTSEFKEGYNDFIANKGVEGTYAYETYTRFLDKGSKEI